MNRLCRVAALALLLSACGDEQPPQVAPEPVPVVVPAVAPTVPAAISEVAAPPVASRVIRAEPLADLPPAPVDLSLPAQLIDELTVGDSSAPIPQSGPLLPPLFVEKPKPESSFQLNGRLLTNDQLSEDYLRSVEGAEIQLQYKH